MASSVSLREQRSEERCTCACEVAALSAANFTACQLLLHRNAIDMYLLWLVHIDTNEPSLTAGNRCANHSRTYGDISSLVRICEKAGIQ